MASSKKIFFVNRCDFFPSGNLKRKLKKWQQTKFAYLAERNVVCRPVFQLLLQIPGRKKIALIYKTQILQNSPFFIFRSKLEGSSCFRLAATKCQSQPFLHGEIGVRIITHRSKRPTSRERKNLKLNQGILVINRYYRKNQHQNRADS